MMDSLSPRTDGPTMVLASGLKRGDEEELLKAQT